MVKNHLSLFNYEQDFLNERTQFVLSRAKQMGADQVVVELSESYGQSVSIRLRQLDTLERMQDQSLSISVFVGQQGKKGFSRGSASSADFSDRSILQAIEAAMAIAKHTEPDEFAGLPDEDALCLKPNVADLDLFHPWHLSSEEAIEIAKRMEASALDDSPKITNSDGANVSTSHGQFWLANSLGFSHGYRFSRHALSVSVVAQEKDELQSQGWYVAMRSPEKLWSPEQVGKYAAERALARLKGKKIKTQNCRVLFDPSTACGLLGAFVQATSGAALYRKSTFLLDALNTSVFASHVRIHEDPFVPQAMGSSPFDQEGVVVRPREVVSNGVLQGWFLSTYTARKLGLKSTGHAGGSHNIYLTSTQTKPEDDFTAMLKRLGTGLLVTDLMGDSVNYMTGDYSRGASGFWVQNGEVVYPVEEITIAGNLKDMFLNMEAIGADVINRGTKYVGSVLIPNMTVAGS
jgi:PmbA protein